MGRRRRRRTRSEEEDGGRDLSGKIDRVCRQVWRLLIAPSCGVKQIPHSCIEIICFVVHTLIKTHAVSYNTHTHTHVCTCNTHESRTDTHLQNAHARARTHHYLPALYDVVISEAKRKRMAVKIARGCDDRWGKATRHSTSNVWSVLGRLFPFFWSKCMVVFKGLYAYGCGL